MLTPLILTIPTLVLPLLMTPTPHCQIACPGDPEVAAQALIEFEMAVNDYAALHRRLERAWPPLSLMADLEQLERTAEELRAAIRATRPQAVRGSLFTAQVADVFRVRIRTALGERIRDLAAITAPADEGLENGWRPVVHDSLPWGTASAARPDFSMLPPLPPELEYRLIGRDLVLLDVPANLVVDTLDLAWPAAGTSRVEEQAEPVGDEFIGCGDDEPAAGSVQRDDTQRHDE
jgi:hypothetical protein